MKNEKISARAFKIAKNIDKTINKEVGYIQERNKVLEAAILTFRNKIILNGGLTDFTILKKYDDHFGIIKT